MRIGWLCLVAALSACHAKDEARALVTAVDAYRAAGNDDKPAKADVIDKVACTDPEVCAAKDACTKSADATARGLRLQQEVQRAAHDAGPYPDDLAKKWKDGKSDLDEGYGYLEGCRAKVEALHERFGI